MDTRALARDCAAAALSNDERKHAFAEIGDRGRELRGSNRMARGGMALSGASIARLHRP